MSSNIKINPQAEKLNESIKEKNAYVYSLLSEKGKIIFFPSKGILGQTADAKNKRINATIGIALEEDKTPIRLNSLSKLIKLSPKEIFPYASSFGKPELRNKWKEMIYDKNQSLKDIDISLPVVSNALTHGLSIVSYMFVEKNEKIIMPDLYWGNYKLIFQNSYEAEIDTFQAFKDSKFNVEGLKQKLDQGNGKKIILLNFPNNPTGYTLTEDESEEVAKAIKKYVEKHKDNKAVVIIDDAYFGLVYEENVLKESIFSKLAGIHEKVLAVKIDGATKEDYVWGLRIGFITYGIKNGNNKLYEALEAKTAGAIRGSISNASHLSQSLLLKTFESKDYWNEKKQKQELLKKRYLAVKNLFQNHPEYLEEFAALPFNSGYFMCIKLKKNAEKIRKLLLEKYDTGVIALDNLLRIAFSAVKTDDIPELFENVFKACKEIDE